MLADVTRQPTDFDGTARGQAIWRYMVVESLVDYVAAVYGPDRLLDLMNGFSHDAEWSDVIPAVLGAPVDEFDEFVDGWNRHVVEQYLQRDRHR